AAGIPRDGGMADLLTEAKAPLPRFAAVVCEDIERSARDTFNALKLEKELSREGIPLFATDEPASIEGVNATTVLVRRVKQGVAEWFGVPAISWTFPLCCFWCPIVKLALVIRWAYLAEPTLFPD